MNKVLERPLKYGFGLILLILIINAGYLMSTVMELNESATWVDHTREVLGKLYITNSAINSAESNQRGYLLSQRQSSLEQYRKAGPEAFAATKKVIQLTADNPPQQQAGEALLVALQQRLQVLQTNLARHNDKQAMELENGDRMTRDIERQITEMIHTEESLLVTRINRQNWLEWYTLGTCLVATILAIGTVGIGFYLVAHNSAQEKKAAQLLRQSEERSRMILESTGEGIYGIDRDGICTFANPACVHMLGYDSADELLGKSTHALLHHHKPDGTPFPKEQCRIYQAVHKGVGISVDDEVFFRRDGSSFPVEYRSYPITRNGTMIGAVVSFVDIASRLSTAESMRLRNGALKAIGQGVFITDPHRPGEPILYVNPSFETMTGYSWQEAMGREIDMLRSPSTDPVYLDRLREAMRIGQADSTELQLARKDGSSFWATIAISPITESGQAKSSHFVGVITDVTARREAEERIRESEAHFRALANSMPQLAWTAQSDGTIDWYNQRWYDYTGTTEADMVNHGWQKVHDPAELPRILPAMQRAFTNGEPYEDTFPLRRHDGVMRWHLTRMVPVKDVRGQVVQWFGTNTDVSESRDLEAALRNTKEMAEEANQAKSQFLANMSHELRTPLNAVIMYSELLMEEAEDHAEDFIPDLEKIRTAGQHLLSLINNVLDLSKIEAGRMELYLEDFDLAATIREVATTIEPLIQRRENHLILRMDDAIGNMHGDLTKVKQTLLNLLSNASKFTEAGQITLDVSRITSESGDRIRMRVQDTGIGMTPEQLGKLFQAFAQADESTTRKYGGTGLGLVITRRLCEMMGGSVSVTSEENKGTTFTIDLPAIMVKHEGLPATEVVPAANASRRGTVLVIDDDFAIRDMMTRFLEKEGFRVLLAANGEAGLTMAKAHKPDLITLDVMMPKLDGWGVLAALKADPDLSHVPVIMLTLTDDRNLGFMLGASEYMTKPIDRARLRSLLSKISPIPTQGRVLIVDDNEVERRHARSILEKDDDETHWTIDEAVNGAAALETLAQNIPDLILLDLMMPTMDGFEFARRLRSNPAWRSIPVVVLTSKDLTANDRARLNGNVQQILTKGAYQRDELLGQIRELLSSSMPQKPDTATI